MGPTRIRARGRSGLPHTTASHCVNPAPGSTPFYVGFTGTTSQTCPAGTSSTNLVNEPANYFYHELLPRLSGTFTMNPNNVFRFSYGRYAQPADTAAEQYNVAQQNLPSFLAGNFYTYGYLQPGHNIPPEVSNNYDLSWEHQIKGTSISWKITPFWRQTNGEQSAFFINPLQAFVSNIPVGNLTSKGVESRVNGRRLQPQRFCGTARLYVRLLHDEIHRIAQRRNAAERHQQRHRNV